MRKAVYALVALGLSGCTSAPVQKEQAALVAEAPEAVASSGLCPAGIGARAGDAPIAQLYAPGGGVLVVCGTALEQTGRSRLLASEFELHYLVPADDRADFLLQLEASETREIFVDEANSKIVLTESVPGAPEIPLFTQEAVCRDDGCVLEAMSCVFRPLSVGDRGRLEGVKEPRSLLRTPEGQTRLVLAALAGDERAKRMFMDKRDPGLSGELAESYEQLRQVVAVSSNLCAKNSSR